MPADKNPPLHSEQSQSQSHNSRNISTFMPTLGKGSSFMQTNFSPGRTTSRRDGVVTVSLHTSSNSSSSASDYNYECKN